MYTPPEESGTVSSGSRIASLTVDKATPAAPEAPSSASETGETRVVLASVSGNSDYGTIQYGYTTGGETEVPEDRWQISTDFDGLQPGTDYTFYSRYSGNDFYTASAKSTQGLQVTTLPQITTSGLVDGTVGVRYSQTLSANSGKTVTWIISGGALPAGLNLNGNTIDGTPTVTADSQSVTIQATISDAGGTSVSSQKVLTITIGKGTPTDPEEGTGYTIDYEEETVTARAGYELSAANSADAEGNDTLSVTPGTDVYVRLKGTQTYHPSNWVTVDIPDRPAAPNLFIETQAEGVILSGNYRYSFNSSTYGEGDWQQGSGQLIQVEPEDTIYIYEAAVNSGENPHFKSEIKSMTAPARAETPSMPSIDYTNETLTDASQSMQYRIDEDGSWTACIDNAMDLRQYFEWDGTEAVTVYFRTAATNSSYASVPTQALTIPARPALDVKVTGVTAKGFTVTVDGAPAGAALTYWATGTGEDADYDSSAQTSGTFTGLKANVLYDISVECAATNSSFSAEAAGTGTTGQATFTVSIPSQAEAGGDPVSISITEDETHPFDLGNGGQVNVKIIDDGNIQNGVLTLTREGASNTVTSALSVGGTLFTDLSQNAAAFTEDSKTPVSLSFAAPTGTNIPAGTYTGTVNFEISYSQ